MYRSSRQRLRLLLMRAAGSLYRKRLMQMTRLLSAIQVTAQGMQAPGRRAQEMQVPEMTAELTRVPQMQAPGRRAPEMQAPEMPERQNLLPRR